jgi:2-amino-4-hydroxy-6-hydroxymethyldihydropteridine diphosphokinase
MSEIAYIALGSNVGDRRAHLRFAIASLEAMPQIEVAALSRIIETDPIGPPGQGPYLNAVAKLVTTLSPRLLLDACLAIERARGRERRAASRWRARTLDIDLLLFCDRIIDEPGLQLPHPLMAERPFVLIPLAEIAPGATHPVLGKPIETLLRRLHAAPVAE